MLRINLVLANDFENIDGQLTVTSESPDLTTISLYELKAALERMGIACTWEAQRPATTMTVVLLGMVSWAIIQQKIIEIPPLFTDRFPECKVTAAATPTLITLDVHLSNEAVASLNHHGAPLLQ